MKLAGLTNREIAETLGLSTQAVWLHVKALEREANTSQAR